MTAHCKHSSALYFFFSFNLVLFWATVQRQWVQTHVTLFNRRVVSRPEDGPSLHRNVLNWLPPGGPCQVSRTLCEEWVSPALGHPPAPGTCYFLLFGNSRGCTFFSLRPGLGLLFSA